MRGVKQEKKVEVFTNYIKLYKSNYIVAIYKNGGGVTLHAT